MTPLECIKKSPSVARVTQQFVQGQSVVVEGLSSSAKAACIALAASCTKKPILVLTATGHEEYSLFFDIPLFTSQALIELQAWETLPQERVAPSPDIVGSRFSSFDAIIKAENPIVLAPLQAVLQKLLPKEELTKNTLQFNQGQTLSFETLLQTLQDMGYERKNICSDKAEFAIRGGIVDIFPVTAQEPVRIEFWGDEIDSIRLFDPASQKSTRSTVSVKITLAKEMERIENRQELQTIFDYMHDPLVVFDDLEALEERYASLTALTKQPVHSFMSIEEFLDEAKKKQSLFFTNVLLENLSPITYTEKKRHAKQYATTSTPEGLSFEIFQRSFLVSRWTHPFESIGRYFERECLLDTEPEGEALFSSVLQLEHTVECFFIVKAQEEESLKTKLREHGIISPRIHTLQGYLSSGLALKDCHLIFFPMTEYTHRKKVRRQALRSYYESPVQDAFDLQPGDFVVHFNHGVGKYLGVEKKPNATGQEQEFFIIEYAEKSKLFVPLPQAHLISKYVGATEETPKLHVIGANRWRTIREQTEKAIVGYAADLIKLYATRQYHGGHQFPEDSNEMRLFEEQFPYVETQDQLVAIGDVKKDMCSAKAMDRLILGDVGYGKTEVAIRAAFKAVKDGKKQVVVLAPTTVLALQHYENFADRMEGFGIRVEALSRFISSKKQKETLKRLQAGDVDIIIGTHRLLQKDVVFKDLGLIIIDEEQRFGVKAKEHLKQLKIGADCLAMSATPIPRTLYMSLVGARDLSVIATPPQDRLPIKTIVAEYDESLIQTALLREFNREGQVYFIHNRVESIFAVGQTLQRLVPRARIVIAHGQMDAHDIDVVFHAFKRGDVDILVATSIVENGIDIPNANTLIVDNADHFGMSDLYQLRGRVGRWNRRAYAYFLTPKRRSLSEISKRRLETIAQAGGYGGGMKVAMRDLEMRGAGDIIGIEQSGHVSSIGFHLYCKLLKRTIDSMQGKCPSWTIDTRVEIPFDARLPESYVNEVHLRMELYQRLGGAITLDEVDSIWNEIIDRFGRPPEQALWLLSLARIRVFAAQRGYTHIKLESYSLFYEKKSGNNTMHNRVLIGTIATPEQLEEKIQKILS